MHHPHRPEHEFYTEPEMPRWWNVLVLAATFVTLALIILDSSETAHSTRDRVYEAIDLVCCAFFVADFIARFRRAHQKRAFLRRNWIDLVSSIPLVGPLRAGRLLRFVRIVRLLRVGRAVRGEAAGSLPQPTVAIGYLGLVTVVVWLSAGTAFYAFEHARNTNIRHLDDALWWSVTTLSTVGYGDIFPVTRGGRVVAALTMVLGIGALASFAGAIATYFVEARDHHRRGLGRFRMTTHLLVLGWNDKALAAVREFRRDPRHGSTALVIVADQEFSPVEDPSVGFVRGNPGRRESLERAAARDAAAAIVLASDASDPRSDHETALVILALRRLNPEASVSAELVDSSNREHLETAGCDSIIDTRAFSSSLLVRGVQDVGVVSVIADLLTTNEGSEIYRCPLAADFVGRTFGELAHSLIERRQILLGIARGHQTIVNAPGDLKLVADDELFVISPEPPAE